jgi:hypothetical protein
LHYPQTDNDNGGDDNNNDETEGDADELEQEGGCQAEDDYCDALLKQMELEDYCRMSRLRCHSDNCRGYGYDHHNSDKRTFDRRKPNYNIIYQFEFSICSRRSIWTNNESAAFPLTLLSLKI